MLQERSHSAFIYQSFACVITLLSLVALIISPADVVVAVNSIHTPEFDFLFLLLTGLGNGIILLPALLLLSFRNISFAMGLAASGITEGIIAYICKRMIFSSAMRPSAVLDASMVHFVPGVEIHKSMSFPSGHTMTIFGLCVFIALCYRNKFVTTGLLILATLVGISRVYLVQHFLTDIVGGAIIGSVTGILFYHLVEQMNKPRWMDQRLDITLRNSNSKPRFS